MDLLLLMGNGAKHRQVLREIPQLRVGSLAQSGVLDSGIYRGWPGR